MNECLIAVSMFSSVVTKLSRTSNILLAGSSIVLGLGSIVTIVRTLFS